MLYDCYYDLFFEAYFPIGGILLFLINLIFHLTNKVTLTKKYYLICVKYFSAFSVKSPFEVSKRENTYQFE